MHNFPDGKRFAFTVFDDTDNSTVQNVGPVYQLLDELGMRTTKSVWALPNVPGARFSGSNLHDRDYLEWVVGLQSKGFEIALHNVRNSDSPRDIVEHGFAEFEKPSRSATTYPRESLQQPGKHLLGRCTT